MHTAGTALQVKHWSLRPYKIPCLIPCVGQCTAPPGYRKLIDDILLEFKTAPILIEWISKPIKTYIFNGAGWLQLTSDPRDDALFDFLTKEFPLVETC